MTTFGFQITSTHFWVEITDAAAEWTMMRLTSKPKAHLWVMKCGKSLGISEVTITDIRKTNNSSFTLPHLCVRGQRNPFFNTLRPRQNGRHFSDDMFKCIFLDENVWIPIEISLKFVPKCLINNNPALFQIMAWRRPGDKPLSETMMVSSLTHICVTRP